MDIEGCVGEGYGLICLVDLLDLVVICVGLFVDV